MRIPDSCVGDQVMAALVMTKETPVTDFRTEKFRFGPSFASSLNLWSPNRGRRRQIKRRASPRPRVTFTRCSRARWRPKVSDCDERVWPIPPVNR